MERPNQDEGRAFLRASVVSVLRNSWRTILLAAGAVTAIVALVAGYYLVWAQPVRIIHTLNFQPTFSGASNHRYPNDMPFSASDIVAPEIIEKVFERNGVEAYCSRDQFRQAFYVERRSPQGRFLEAEYLARLSEPRLTSVERERLQAEYDAKRTALPVQFRLVFVVPPSCQSIPEAVASKSMADVLSVWAEHSETRRGVLRLQVPMLTANSLDVGLEEPPRRLVRADLIRRNLRRLIENVRSVERVAGAIQVRMAPTQLTLPDLRTKLEDLLQARLEPLIVSTGHGLGSDSLLWAEEALASATRDQRAAEERALAYLSGLREYSGVPQAPAASAGQQTGQPSAPDGQSVVPQIDRTFIDRIIELSATNTAFRQEMTNNMVQSEVQAIESRARASYYARLAQALRNPDGPGLEPAVIDQRLQAIVDAGQGYAKQFSDLYDEISRVMLRPDSGMYRATNQGSEVARSFTPRGYALTLFATFVVAVLLAAALSFLRAMQPLLSGRGQEPAR